MNSDVSRANGSNSIVSAETHAVAFASWLDSKVNDAILHRAEAKERRSANGDSIVMIVDDKQVVAITLAELLRRHGLNAVWFSEPLVALQYAKEGAVDLLISNFNMPLMDGIRLATEIQNTMPTCSLFLFSAVCDQPEFKSRVKALGPGVHIEAKPLHMEKLLSTVADLLLGQSAVQLKSHTLKLFVS